MQQITTAQSRHVDAAQVLTSSVAERGYARRLRPLVLAMWLLTPPVWAIGTIFAEPAIEQFEFDGSMLVGGANKQSMARFNRPDVTEPGVYQVDVFVNGIFLARQTLTFTATGEQGRISACFSRDALIDMGLLSSSINVTEEQVLSESCLHLEQQVSGASSHFDFARLRLDLFIPQALMKRIARGSVSVEDLSAGEAAGFVNYDTNYYHTRAKGNDTGSIYLGLNSGFNLGLWQLRQQSSFTRYSSEQSPTLSNWNAVRTYVQRPIPALNSALTIGDSFTSGSLFSSIGFRGIQLQTDDRMLPESQRGYAPTIRGVAASTAKVMVKQAGIQVYQTTVAPGAFVIDDLYPTSFQGDLVVEVQEADGRVSSFTVPFSAVPDSMRPGRSHLNISAGQVRNIGDSNAMFADVTYQTGVSNAVTGNAGVRISDGYQALLGGAVFASRYGALGVNTVYSRSDMWGENFDGWRIGATYSRTFTTTATTLALAGYRYSTQGYRDLGDVLGLRNAHDRDAVWLSSTYQQSEQVVASISQGLGEYGQLYFAGSTNTYRGGRGRDTQYQMAYSHSYSNISYNLSLSRQQTGSPRYGVQSTDNVSNSTTQNIVMFSVSVPLGRQRGASVLSAGLSYETGRQGNSHYQSALSGAIGAAQSLSYSVNGTYDSGGNGSSFGANITKQLPVATVGGSLSRGKNYIQGGLSARGAIVAHADGVTLGPYLGDTFALVEAKGMGGAEVMNGMGAKIDSFGYAIVPSLVPYRYNDINLDAKGVRNSRVELTENQQRVAPYAGAVVKVRFNTLEGYPLLIKLETSSKDALPLGANVYDSNNTVIGLVGQGNQLYARASGKQGAIRVKWGDAPGEQCRLKYDLRGESMAQSLYRLVLPCSNK